MLGPLQQALIPIQTNKLNLYQLERKIRQFDGRCVYRIQGEQQGEKVDNWVLFSPKEYDQFRREHSRWTWSCDKISLDGITRKAFALIKKETDSATAHIPDQINVDSPQDITTMHTVIQRGWLSSIYCDRRGKAVLVILKEKITSYKQSHEIEKTQGIWGWIKWFIWSCFDNSHLLLKDIEKAQFSYEAEYLHKVKQALTIKARANIQDFKEILSGKTNTTDKDIIHIEDVKEWLETDHPDHYLLDTVEGLEKKAKLEKHRNAVLAIINIWDALKMEKGSTKDIKAQAISSPPKQRSSTNIQSDIPQEKMVLLTNGSLVSLSAFTAISMDLTTLKQKNPFAFGTLVRMCKDPSYILLDDPMINITGSLKRHEFLEENGSVKNLAKEIVLCSVTDSLELQSPLMKK